MNKTTNQYIDTVKAFFIVLGIFLIPAFVDWIVRAV